MPPFISWISDALCNLPIPPSPLLFCSEFGSLSFLTEVSSFPFRPCSSRSSKFWPPVDFFVGELVSPFLSGSSIYLDLSFSDGTWGAVRENSDRAAGPAGRTSFSLKGPYSLFSSSPIFARGCLSFVF